jgi:hypothetical protein
MDALRGSLFEHEDTVPRLAVTAAMDTDWALSIKFSASDEGRSDIRCRLPFYLIAKTLFPPSRRSKSLDQQFCLAQKLL